MPSSRYDIERDAGRVRTVSEEEIDPSLLMGESAAAGAMADPDSIAAQRYAMDRIGREARYASRGRLTPEDQVQYEQTQALGQVAGRGAREASLQQMQARGQAGADTELLYNQMGAQQEASSDAAMDAQMQAGLADRSRQLQSAYSQLARGVRGQEFGESYDTGAAQDQAGWFDADYQRTVNNRNVERRHDQSRADAEGTQRRWGNEARYLTGGAGEMAQNMLDSYEDNQRRSRAGYNTAMDMVDLGGSIAGAYFGGGLGGGDDDDDDDD